jgi:hypothetical protein
MTNDKHTFAEYDNLLSHARTRGEAGRLVLDAYADGYNRAQIAQWLGCSVGYVSTLASIVRTTVHTGDYQRLPCGCPIDANCNGHHGGA